MLVLLPSLLSSVNGPPLHFIARDSIYAIARICYRPSVCPSVRLSVTRVDQSKTVEVRIMQLSPPGSLMTLVS